MSVKIPNRQKWFINENKINPSMQLDSLVDMYMGYMYDKTFMMFEYENLPDNITNKDIEKVLQTSGKGFWLHHNGRYYFLDGAFSNNITWNYEYKDAIIKNSALPKLKNKYVIDEDCVLIPNDSLFIGLYPMMENNAIQLAQTDISLSFASFNTRFKSIFTANDDNSKDSINQVIDSIWNGEKPSAVLTEDLYKKSVEGIEYNRSHSNDIQDLIELKQYIKANWFMDLGINANYNMKRETLNESEMQVNDDSLMPLIDNMLYCRKEAVNKINDKYGLNIKVDYSSAWKKIRKEMQLGIQLQEKEVSEEGETNAINQVVRNAESDN